VQIRTQGYASAENKNVSTVPITGSYQDETATSAVITVTEYEDLVKLLFQVGAKR
jgi:hypothetical protein